jgi:hypothetical protein
VKGMFNATCDECKDFKPNCAKVWIREPLTMRKLVPSLEARILCADCRKKPCIRNCYTVAPEHKPAKRAKP